jgi:nicotinamide mononucleotide transporter
MYIEIIAVIFTLLSVYLAMENNIHNWWTGIIGLSFYSILFFQSHLSANLVLQIVYLYQSIVGWYLWSEVKNKPSVKISSVFGDSKGLIYNITLSVLVFFSCYYGSDYIFNNPMKTLDCISTALCIVGNKLLMQRKLETWYFWILADIIYVPLFLLTGFWLSAVLYLAFLVLAVRGFMQWNQEYILRIITLDID